MFHLQIQHREIMAAMPFLIVVVVEAEQVKLE
jgi:hypothetical protein